MYKAKTLVLFLIQPTTMSCVGSVVSNCSSVTTGAGDQTSSVLQKCHFLRDTLELAKYKTNGTTILAPHIKISSKVLKECYVLPGDGPHIDGVFSKLADVMRYCKESMSTPPRTDFTCLSRLDRNKVYLDIDCVRCKSGSAVKGKRHYSFTALLNTIVPVVERLFDEHITDGVYTTNGGLTCGYHVFFNSLAYGDGVTEAALMDALAVAFKQIGETNAVIDRGCTQMPLPSAMHSNSSQHTKPYAVTRDISAGWKKQRLNWINMDAETLKCFSTVAFPERYREKIFGRNTTSLDVKDVQSSGARKRKNSASSECTIPAKQMCLYPNQERTAGEVPSRATVVCEEESMSVVSTDTVTSSIATFMCPKPLHVSEDNVHMPPPPPSQEKGQRRRRPNGKQKTDYDDTVGRLTNVIESLPYACESDKTSSFPDKQYKAALLTTEETEAAESRARLENENRIYKSRQRVYIVSGSSSNVPREYRLLVQLVNVNRAVYRGDLNTRREWNDILVTYYDQHLRNPVLLELMKFVFCDQSVAPLFGRGDMTECFDYLMKPFVRNNGDQKSQVHLEDEERLEHEARPYKTRLIGALVRVCTHMFGMVTAIMSDLRRIQRAQEKRDLKLLNCTVVTEKPANEIPASASLGDDDLDCSASNYDSASTILEDHINTKYTSTYSLLASLIIHEENNLSDQALYALLYYYHHFPSSALDRIMDEVHHEGLMVTAVIKYFLMYDHRGKTLTLQEIFEGFNDVTVSMCGPEMFVLLTAKSKQRGEKKGASANKKSANGGKGNSKNDDDASQITENTDNAQPTEMDLSKIMSGAERKRRRKMCYTERVKDENGDRVMYEWKDKHVLQAVIDYYLRPVAMHEDKLVFGNNGYDTSEDDAVESCVAHLRMMSKYTKADIVTAFRDSRTVWRMHHGSQLLYESDLGSDTLGCCFNINVALKMYEMFCGGCVTRMKRVHRHYLIDRTRFNMSVYDVVAECRSATVNLTSAIDRSYMNLLLQQPIVPPFLEEIEIRQLFMSNGEIQRGSFCCLSMMDYIRAINMYDRSHCHTKPELETCEYVETFLDDLYTNQVAAESPANLAANTKLRLLYTFYSMYIYEVIFNMRLAYARRENCYVSIERLCNELDIRELLILFFGESSMKRVEGLSKELEHRICVTADGWNENNSTAKDGRSDATATSNANGRFDVRPFLSADIPSKMVRMQALFGQFGFDVMQDGGCVDTSTGGDQELPFDHKQDCAGNSSSSGSTDGQGDKCWEDESKFEHEFYVNDNWLDTVYQRISNKRINGKTSRQTPILSKDGSDGKLFVRETVRTIMRVELKRHIDNDRLCKLAGALKTNTEVFGAMKNLPIRLKLLAFILTTHTFKLKTTRLAADFVEATYRDADGRYDEEQCVYQGEVNSVGRQDDSSPEKVWCRTTDSLLNDRRSLFLHARWLADQRFKDNFFVGLDPAQMYSQLYEYMKKNENQYPVFKKYSDNEDTKPYALSLCTAMMYVLIMSAYDQEHVELYLKLFLAVEFPGQWLKTFFVFVSNSNAGKSYLFDSIIKRACANSTCINDPKGGKENAPEKAEYVKNFVLFANEFSHANSNELKKIVSESTFKFRMNYGNVMMEVYTTGKIMFNCNTLPPTSDEAAINRLTLFNIPFWFCKRQKISDAMLNWIRGPNVTSCTRWETAYRYELPNLLTEEEKTFFDSHNDTKDEKDLFDAYAAVLPSRITTEFARATSSLFLVQNKSSRLYVASYPPTDRIVQGLVNITTHFSWMRYLKNLETPVDFSTLPATSQAVRSEWLSLTLPYQEWKQLTGARTDPTGRVQAESIYKSLQAFATKKNVNYFGIRQFFETDFASSRDAIKGEYYMWFDAKAIGD